MHKAILLLAELKVKQNFSRSIFDLSFKISFTDPFGPLVCLWKIRNVLHDLNPMIFHSLIFWFFGHNSH